MKKSFIGLLLLILIAGIALQAVSPWWTVAPLCLALAFAWPTTGARSFLAGFLGIGLGWLLLAGWQHLRTEGVLSQRVAQLLPLGGNGWALVFVTALVGGLAGGIAALAGYWLRQAVSPKPATAENANRPERAAKLA
ncbi:hypothetical protein [Hymenobacter koreensis]|uniref:Uncharacterized protein n=1 Tax=Hymenobacter koreensis TaxID=1084523 RepID=A0ABP8IXI0_9BACT